MERAFLDANIFFAAAGSPQGGSGFILELAKKHNFEVITVNQALLEAEQNIRGKLNFSCLSRHYQNLLAIKLKIQPINSITSEQITRLEKLVPLKDIPILYGAVVSNSQVLITLDKRHFLENKKLKEVKTPFEVMNPKEFLKKYFLR